VWSIAVQNKFVLSRLGISNNVELTYIERDYFVICSCSGLIPLKRVHLIAEALFRVKEIRIHWVHIGDGPELEKLKMMIGKLSENISVELKGSIPNSAIYALYNEIKPDLFINVSSTEGVPVSIMEAMSFGIPVLATDVGGTSEIVNEYNGLLLEEDITSSDLSEIITSALHQPEKLKLKGNKAHQKWKQEFNAESNYLALIDSLLAD
jgi:glycosyltransferase involved in cell wall biosynthesis